MELKYPKGKNGKVICQECGKDFKLLSPSHLKRKHNGMTISEYKLKYPGCPMSGHQYKTTLFTFKDSVLFKGDEEEETKALDEDIEFAELDEGKIKHTILNLEGVPKNKADILTFLHEAYPYLKDNYIIEKRHFHDDRLLWKYVTDMADPVKKVLFDFPNSFWHNIDSYPDPMKFDKLTKEGWIVISIDKHYPTVKDVYNDTDIISD